MVCSSASRRRRRFRSLLASFIYVFAISWVRSSDDQDTAEQERSLSTYLVHFRVRRFSMLTDRIKQGISRVVQSSQKTGFSNWWMAISRERCDRSAARTRTFRWRRGKIVKNIIITRRLWLWYLFCSELGLSSGRRSREKRLMLWISQP